MSWWITDGILQRARVAPSENSIKPDISDDDAEVRIPEGTTTVRENSFTECPQIKAIAIPSSVTVIEEGAFGGSENLTDIRISENHPVFRVENDCLISKNGVLLWARPDAEEMVVPSGVVRIGNRAFYRCRVKRVEIPEGVTAIGKYAFYSSNLTKAALPDGLKYIEEQGFAQCRELTEIELPDSAVDIGTKAFYICCRLKKMVIPYGVTEIKGGMFTGCREMTSIHIPNSVRCIKDRAFVRCDSLQKLVIPESVTQFEEKSFGECKNIFLPRHLFLQMSSENVINRSAIGCLISPREVSAKVNTDGWRWVVEMNADSVNQRLKLCIGFAINREKYSRELCEEYFSYIRENAAGMMRAAFDYPELLHLMCGEGLIAAQDVGLFLEEALKRGNVEQTAMILGYRAKITADSAHAYDSLTGWDE